MQIVQVDESRKRKRTLTINVVIVTPEMKIQ